MSAKLLSEGLIRLSTVARLLPENRGGRGPHPSTISRWINFGVKTRSGRTVRLEAVKVGQSWQTSRQAVERFLEALSAEPGAVAEPACSGHTPATERALDAILGPVGN
jgi:hypothetical protein